MNYPMNLIALFTLIALASAQSQSQPTRRSTTTHADSVPGILLSNMDVTVRPGQDFYRYVNGGWTAVTNIPTDQARWSAHDSVRAQVSLDLLTAIAQAQPADYPVGSDVHKALLFFRSAMDTAARNRAGINPLQPVLNKIANVGSLEALQALLATDATVTNPFFNLAVDPSLNHSLVNAAYVAPGSLQLPQNYYMNQDHKTRRIRSQYLEHIIRMLQFAGDTPAEAHQNAQTVLKLETQLAQPRLDRVTQRDTRTQNNPRSLAQLSQLVAAIDWRRYFDEAGLVSLPDTVIITQPKYIQTLQSVLTETPLEDLKALVRWATLDDAAEYLSVPIAQADWEFYGHTLNGSEQPRPLEESALNKVSWEMSDAIGRLYVDAVFSSEAKEAVKQMVDNIIRAFEKRITTLNWMSDTTKVQAIDKLNHLTIKIGYPDEWEDYAGIDIKKENTYFENIASVAAWERKNDFQKVAQPVNNVQWDLPPQVVTAYYNSSANEIVFPAGILRPPFYNHTADAAVNYGGIGAIIGHEISHAFDDDGARFDKYGNLVNWWTDVDLEKFTQRGKELITQYDTIEVLDSVFVNGALTLGENIGDLGGVLVAYDALLSHLVEHGRPGNIDELTPEQRFFISWATIRRSKIREDALRAYVETNSHSPGQVRAVQPLRNVDAFYETFDIQPTDSLYIAPEARVRIW